MLLGKTSHETDMTSQCHRKAARMARASEEPMPQLSSDTKHRVLPPLLQYASVISKRRNRYLIHFLAVIASRVSTSSAADVRPGIHQSAAPSIPALAEDDLVRICQRGGSPEVAQRQWPAKRKSFSRTMCCAFGVQPING